MNYPQDALQVRDLIADLLRSQADHGSAMDTGGGLGSADLWVWIGGREFYVSVQPRAQGGEG